MNARDVVNTGVVRLRAAGVEEAVVKMEWLIASLAGIRRAEIDIAPIDASDVSLLNAFDDGIERMSRHEPLQYVLHSAPFLGLELYIDKSVLIPRPETEELVTRVLFSPDIWVGEEVHLVDVGTGSGCIAVAIAQRRPQARIYGADLSEDALEIAQINIIENEVDDRVRLVQCDLLEAFNPNSLDGIVSNPPYIASADIAMLDKSIREYEPRTALDGGPDGLDVIRALAPQAHLKLRKGGRIWLEIGENQGDAVSAILEKTGFHDIAITRDMYGNIRFAEAVR